jgi:hypothetical protein
MASANFGSSYVTRPRTIEVPLQHEQVLEVVCNDLPSNPTELTDIFRQEKVDLSYYRMLAVKQSLSLFRVLFSSNCLISFFLSRSNTMSKIK